MLSHTLINARSKLVRIGIEISNQIRGMMKTFGLVVPRSAGNKFDIQVQNLLSANSELSLIILPLLEAWRAVRARAADLGRKVIVQTRADEKCQLLMSVPGVGAITATAFIAAVEDPTNFKRSRSVGAWLGLTTRRYQSGEVDYDGHISRRGDAHLRGLLYEAATVILTRARADSDLRTWDTKLRERIGFKRAAVAVARKLAVIMHAMLQSGELFNKASVAI
jgi:transposase